ncbi:hypothetical protein PUN28_001198 [Cardiocondyla obscurior]|uniref:Uncharacterized protein n=1 Tax=Cardiocondyla obscurior TaxID=286306 RepID=A0AAW2H3V6_9HYME
MPLFCHFTRLSLAERHGLMTWSDVNYTIFRESIRRPLETWPLSIEQYGCNIERMHNLSESVVYPQFKRLRQCRTAYMYLAVS